MLWTSNGEGMRLYNDGLDLSEQYFRKKKNDIVDYVCFTQEESEPPHY